MVNAVKLQSGRSEIHQSMSGVLCADLLKALTAYHIHDSLLCLQSGSVPDIPAFTVQPVTLNPLNTQQGNPSFRMESQTVTPRASSFRRTGTQARNSFRASAENRIPPFSADGQYQVRANLSLQRPRYKLFCLCFTFQLQEIASKLL